MTPSFAVGHANLPCWEGIPRESRPKLDVDRISGTYVTPTTTALAGGDALPGYAGMIIFDCEAVRTSQCIRWRIDAQGSLDGSNPTKTISNGKRRTLDEGWDQRSITVKTWDADLYALGDEHATYPFLYVHDIDQSDDGTDWKTLNVTYLGLEEEKPFKRRINGTVNVTNTQFSGFSSFTGDIYLGYPPIDSGTNASLSGTDIAIEFDNPGISVTDTLISVDAPPVSMIGKFWTPQDAPDITYLTLAGTGIKYFIPFGWKCANIASEQIPGKDLWLMSITWVHQPASVPTE